MASAHGGMPSMNDGDADVMSMSSEHVLGQRSFFNNTDLPTGFLFSPLSTPLGHIPHCSDPPPQCTTCGAFANKFSEYDHASTAWICNFCGCGCVFSEGLGADAPFKHCEDFDFLPAATDEALSSDQCWPALVSLVVDATLDDDFLEEVVEACRVLLHRLPDATLVSLIAFDSAVTLFELAPPNEAAADFMGPAQSWVLPGDTQASQAMLQRLCASSGGLIAPVGACMHAACAALDSLRPLHLTLKPRARPRCIGAALAATHGLYEYYKESQLITLPSKASLRVLLMLGGPCTVGPGSAPVAVLDTGAARANPEDQFMLLEAQRFVEQLAGDIRSSGMIVDFISGGLNASNIPLWNRCVKRTGGTIMIQEGFGGLLPQSLIAMLHRHQAKSVSLDFFATDGLAIEQVIGPSVTTAPSATFHARKSSVRGGVRDRPASAMGTRGDIYDTQPQHSSHRRTFSENWAQGLSAGKAPVEDAVGFRRSMSAACNAEGLEAGQAFAVVLKSGRDVEGRYAIVQAAARWCTPTGMWVMRVSTRRLGVTTNYGTYINSLQHSTATVLLAKCLILAAEKGAAKGDVSFLEDSQARCASVLRGVARTVGVHKRNEGGRPGSARGLLGGLGGLLKNSLWGEDPWSLQPDLLPVAEALYSLQRGSMLGRVVGHADECAQLFHLFLKADLPLARAMLVPRAHQVTIDADRCSVREMRPCDLVLDSNSAVILDCGTHIFLWLGANMELPPNLQSAIRQYSLAALEASSADDATAAQMLQAQTQNPSEAFGILSTCVRVAHACAVGRVPVPELKVCLEGTGDERYVLSRLAPTDSVDRGDLVLAQLPHLVELYEEDADYAAAMVAHITRRLPSTDEPGFAAWAEQAGVDVRPALLGEDPDIDAHGASGKLSGGGVPPQGASSRPSSAKRASRPSSARDAKARRGSANLSGDAADSAGIFRFLSRKRSDNARAEQSHRADVEVGMDAGMSAHHTPTLPPSAAHQPYVDPYAHHSSAQSNAGSTSGNAHGMPTHATQMSSPASLAHHSNTSQESLMYTPPQPDGHAPNNIANQPFRHPPLPTPGAQSSPRSPMVPMPPRPPSLSALQAGARPGVSKPPLVPAVGPGYHFPGGSHSLAAGGPGASTQAEGKLPLHDSSSAHLDAQNLRAVRGLQSPEPASKGPHIHAGVSGAPNSHPQMQRPTPFQYGQ